MANMASNDYRQMAQAIMAEGGQGKQSPFDPKSFAMKRRQAWDETEDGSESGFDQETLQMLLDQLGNEGVAALSAGDVSNAMLREAPSEEVSSSYGNLSAEDKLKLLQEIVNSDGLGSMENIIGEFSSGNAQGGDASYGDALNEVIQSIGPEQFLQMSAEEMANATGWNISPEEAQLYDTMSPEDRMGALNYIIQSAGMGSFQEYMDEQVRKDVGQPE